MATFNKYNSFVEDLAEKVHNLQTDTLKVMLSNTAPAATDTAVPTEIASTSNGYTAGGNTITVTSSVQTSGVYKLILVDSVFTQSGANAIGPFRYVVLYNSTATKVIGWYDYGSSITLAAAGGETFTVDFDGTGGVFTIT
jgi:hypothetical protein